jgi:GDP-4-dehydro-6-deoxy-D-mannose reductase
MKALITGSGGFVGGYLTEHLSASGDEVICSDVSLGGPDLLDPDGLTTLISDTRPDLVYHLAGQADVKKSWESPLRTFRVNAEGTFNLLLACQKSDVKRVLCVSSAEVYGQIQESDLPISETQPMNPTNPYATSKSAAELICKQFNSQGLEIMRVRAFNHFGPGQRENFVAAALAKRMILAEQNGESEIIVGNLNAIRDFTDVRDVVRAYRLILLKGEGGNVYNVCSGTGRRVQDLAATLLSFINSELELKIDPKLYRPADTPSIIGDYTRLHKQTGWDPRIEFEQTIKDIITSTRDILTKER